MRIRRLILRSPLLMLSLLAGCSWLVLQLWFSGNGLTRYSNNDYMKSTHLTLNEDTVDINGIDESVNDSFILKKIRRKKSPTSIQVSLVEQYNLNNVMKSKEKGNVDGVKENGKSGIRNQFLNKFQQNETVKRTNDDVASRPNETLSPGKELSKL